jgi:hypothetical protein
MARGFASAFDPFVESSRVRRESGVSIVLESQLSIGGGCRFANIPDVARTIAAVAVRAPPASHETSAAHRRISAVSTLSIVEQVLRTARVPLTVQQIAKRAGPRLPSTAKRPDTVIARDLSLNIRQLGKESRFTRTARGMFTLREFVGRNIYEPEPQERSGWKWTAEQLRARVIRQRASR